MAELIAFSIPVFTILTGILMVLFRKLFKLIAEIDENYNKEE